MADGFNSSRTAPDAPHPEGARTPPRDSASTAPPQDPETPLQTGKMQERLSGSQDSPIAGPRSAQSTEGRTNLESVREFLALDLGPEALEVDVDWMFDYGLPQLPDKVFDVKAIVQRLKDRGDILEYPGGVLRWKKFQVEPKDSREREPDAFRPLVDVCEAITGALTRKELEHQIAVYCSKSEASPGVVGDGSPKPDGVTILKDHKDEVKEYMYHYISSVWEHKKVPEPDEKANDKAKEARDDNVRKSLNGGERMMNAHLGRRFVHAVMMQNTDTRVWLMNRSTVVVSKPFDFNKDPERFVRLYLALTCGTPESLGWDHNVTIKEATRDRATYEITHMGRKYENAEVVVDNAAQTIVGRGSRIISAIDADTKKRVLIKDVWTADGRLTESEIIEQIREGVEKEIEQEKEREKGKDTDNKPKTVEDAMQYFLAPIKDASGKVEIQQGVIDHTQAVMTRGEEIPDTSRYRLQLRKVPGATKIRAGVGSTGDSARQRNPPPPTGREIHLVHPRYHCRLVYDQIGLTLYAITDFTKVPIMLCDVAKALETMHRLGWLHRDVSAGNIYIIAYRNKDSQLAWRGLLGDFEHAKRIDDDTPREWRTGTYEFMSVEIAFWSYEFAPEGSLGASADQITEQLMQEMHGQPERPVTAAVRFNRLHDLESLWWCTIYSLFMKPQRIQDPGDLNRLDALEKTCYSLFPSYQGSNDRLRLLKDGKRLLAEIRNIPPPFRLFAPSLVFKLQDVLIDHFKNVEASSPDIDRKAAGTGAHSEFIRVFAAFPEVLARLKMTDPNSIPPLREMGNNTKIKILWKKALQELIDDIAAVPSASIQHPLICTAEPKPLASTPSVLADAAKELSLEGKRKRGAADIDGGKLDASNLGEESSRGAKIPRTED